MNIFRATATLAVLLLGCSVSNHSSKMDLRDEANDEAQVYAAVFKERYVESTRYVGENAKLFLINNETSADMERLETFRSDMGLVSQEVLKDFLIKNAKPQQLDLNLDLTVKVIPITKEEVLELIHVKGGIPDWTNLYKKYPTAAGVISLSRVGFNQQRTEALVELNRRCGRGCGEGAFLYLIKSGNDWSVKESYAGWMA